MCRFLGHEVVAVDTYERPRMFRDVTDLLGLDVLDVHVTPFVPLPLPPPAYDIITSYMVTFNGHRTPNVWGVHEWRYLLGDLRTRLAPGGTMVFELNNEPPEYETCYTPALRAFFEDSGAAISAHRLEFNP